MTGSGDGVFLLLPSIVGGGGDGCAVLGNDLAVETVDCLLCS